MQQFAVGVIATLVGIYAIGFALVLFTPKSSFSPAPKKLMEAAWWPMLLLQNLRSD